MVGLPLAGLSGSACASCTAFRQEALPPPTDAQNAHSRESLEESVVTAGLCAPAAGGGALHSCGGCATRPLLGQPSPPVWPAVQAAAPWGKLPLCEALAAGLPARVQIPALCRASVVLALGAVSAAAAGVPGQPGEGHSFRLACLITQTQLLFRQMASGCSPRSEGPATALSTGTETAGRPGDFCSHRESVE